MSDVKVTKHGKLMMAGAAVIVSFAASGLSLDYDSPAGTWNEALLDENKSVAERNAPYFCGVNFARNIKIPIRVEVGSADHVCPPMAGFSAFNVMPSKDKEIHIGLGQGHAVFKEYRSKLDRWLSND